ncbi:MULTISPECIES: hypothetical protein [Pseudomonas]|jgi:hypothetical protein|uniref:Uncharacterized protein n=1 Tax=Pseudomonas beijingensis TaxID=2954101 RepID=A0ABY9F8L6_9PSED|nr:MULTISPECIES: hypothetical protein [unclassified Pseudomonas]WLG99168.1 hypothetical protein PSH92_17450 [Pseudomonas sp. FP2034]WLH44292.1 hypothetical protein PSH83_18090 [Pseudomonas sp. FP2262]WLI44263.1 hypothetical protein PSH84_22310 [Pseudomonas sp. FP830]
MIAVIEARERYTSLSISGLVSFPVAEQALVALSESCAGLGAFV